MGKGEDDELRLRRQGDKISGADSKIQTVQSAHVSEMRAKKECRSDRRQQIATSDGHKFE